MINVTINISKTALQTGQIAVQECREWCAQQHYNAAYSGFIILLLFNVIMTAVFILLYNNSDKIRQSTKMSEEKLAIILHSVVLCVFIANALYGVYWIFLR